MPPPGHPVDTPLATDMGQGGYLEQSLDKRAQCLMTFKLRMKCTWHRHMDQLRHRHGNTTTTTAFPHNETSETHRQTTASSDEVIETQDPGPTDTLITEPQSQSTTAVEPEPAEVTGLGLPFQAQETTSLHSGLTTGAEERRYPVRCRKPPD